MHNLDKEAKFDFSTYGGTGSVQYSYFNGKEIGSWGTTSSFANNDSTEGAATRSGLGCIKDIG